MGGRGGGPNASALGQAQKQAVSGDSELQDVLDAYREGLRVREEINRGRFPEGHPNRVALALEDPIGLLDVRAGLTKRGWDRERQDQVLTRLYREQKITLFPLANQKILSQAERDTGIMLGRENRNGIMLPTTTLKLLGRGRGV